MAKKILILDSIRSMQNVGAIFRNADGAWFDTLYLCWFTPSPPRSDISKTALGAEKTIFWEYYEDALEITKKLKKQGVRVYWLELVAWAKDFRKISQEQNQDIAIILGNEVSWVSEALLALSDEYIMIPMMGQKNSLNVSVAAGVVMYGFLWF